MDISFDPAKDARNVARRDYGEARFQALGLIENRLHMLVFTPCEGRIHIISLRKANDREIRHYEEAQAQP